MSKIIQPTLWKRFMTILEIKHYRGDECIWEAREIPNLLHSGGEEFILKVCFDTDAGPTIPDFYYLGTDNRTTILSGDTLEDLSGEPAANVNGYDRQALSSMVGFSVATSGTSQRATTGIVSFNAIGGQWGPVQNIFLATTEDDTGYLLATASLSSARTVLPGESLTVRFGLSLQDCAGCP